MASANEQLKKMNIINKLLGKRPEHVKYGELGGRQLARTQINKKTGEIELAIKGEKYPLRCHPRHHVLHGPMVELKRRMKNLVIENLADQISKTVKHKTPESQWAIPVREIARVFDLMIEAEDEPSMKKLMKQLRDPICMILEEDDAWRFRLQWYLEHLNMKKIKLSKSDKYYFRAKSFKVDGP